MNMYDNFNNHNGALKVKCRTALRKCNAGCTRESNPYQLGAKDCSNSTVTSVIRAVIGHRVPFMIPDC